MGPQPRLCPSNVSLYTNIAIMSTHASTSKPLMTDIPFRLRSSVGPVERFAAGRGLEQQFDYTQEGGNVKRERTFCVGGEQETGNEGPESIFR